VQGAFAAPPYVVARNDAGDAVEVFSTERLPYEPRGWLLDLRAELRTALKEMRSQDGALLSAVYASPVAEFCDVENVLIYNVGTGHLGGVASKGIRLERGYFSPEPPVELSGEARHYACYSAAPLAQGFACWEAGSSLAEWSRVPMPALSETTKPSAIWYAMRTSALAVIGMRQDVAAPYGLELVLGAPSSPRTQPAKVVKPLVDGVIAAMHAHDGRALGEVAGRLRAQLPSATAQEIAELLVDERANVLGQRRLLWLRATGVQWNPADDLCVALELRVEPARRRELSGRLFSVSRMDQGEPGVADREGFASWR
jgi:hypothetical protein